MSMKYAILAIGLAAMLSGCSGGSAAADLSPAQEKQANDIDSLAKKCNYDWNKLSPADQKQFVLLCGSEQGAKMQLLGMSGKLGHHGPPSGAAAPK